jgi:hypothetical protein
MGKETTTSVRTALFSQPPAWRVRVPTADCRPRKKGTTAVVAGRGTVWKACAGPGEGASAPHATPGTRKAAPARGKRLGHREEAQIVHSSSRARFAFYQNKEGDS